MIFVVVLCFLNPLGKVLQVSRVRDNTAREAVLLFLVHFIIDGATVTTPRFGTSSVGLYMSSVIIPSTMFALKEVLSAKFGCLSNPTLIFVGIDDVTASVFSPTMVTIATPTLNGQVLQRLRGAVVKDGILGLRSKGRDTRVSGRNG